MLRNEVLRCKHNKPIKYSFSPSPTLSCSNPSTSHPIATTSSTSVPAPPMPESGAHLASTDAESSTILINPAHQKHPTAMEEKISRQADKPNLSSSSSKKKQRTTGHSGTWRGTNGTGTSGANNKPSVASARKKQRTSGDRKQSQVGLLTGPLLELHVLLCWIMHAWFNPFTVTIRVARQVFQKKSTWIGRYWDFIRTVRLYPYTYLHTRVRVRTYV